MWDGVKSCPKNLVKLDRKAISDFRQNEVYLATVDVIGRKGNKNRQQYKQQKVASTNLA